MHAGAKMSEVRKFVIFGRICDKRITRIQGWVAVVGELLCMRGPTNQED